MNYSHVVAMRRGGPAVLQVMATALRPLARGEVQVKVLAAAVSLVDVEARYGRLRFPPKVPFTSGYAIVGVVDEVGTGVTTAATGDRVAALTVYGGYAEYVYLNRPAQPSCRSCFRRLFRLSRFVVRIMRKPCQEATRRCRSRSASTVPSRTARSPNVRSQAKRARVGGHHNCNYYRLVPGTLGDNNALRFDAYHIPQKRGGFPLRKAQIVGAEFFQFASSTQTCQRDRRVCSGGDDQAQMVWQMVEPIGQKLMYQRRLDNVIVIQHQDSIGSEVIQVTEQGLEDELGWQRAVRRSQGCCAAYLKVFKGISQVAGKFGGIIIPAVQREPDNGLRLRLPGRPFCQQSCLAKPCRGGNQSEQLRYSDSQLVEQTRSMYQRLPESRNIELGLNGLRGRIQ